MSLLPTMAFALIAGIGLGLFYFGGLWLTMRRLPTTRWPVPLALSSFLGRTAIVLVGFYFVMGGRWERVVVCLVGFLMARFLLTSRLRPDRLAGSSTGKEDV